MKYAIPIGAPPGPTCYFPYGAPYAQVRTCRWSYVDPVTGKRRCSAFGGTQLDTVCKCPACAEAFGMEVPY